MSNQVNEELLERAAEMIDCFEGTQIARRIELSLESKDYEGLYANVSRAEVIMAQEQFYGNEAAPKEII